MLSPTKQSPQYVGDCFGQEQERPRNDGCKKQKKETNKVSFFVSSGAGLAAQRADLKYKTHVSTWVLLVAGAGLEPATFGL